MGRLQHTQEPATWGCAYAGSLSKKGCLMLDGNSLVRWLKTRYENTLSGRNWRVRGVLSVALIIGLVLANYGISAVRAEGDQSEVTVCVNKWNGAMRVLMQGSCSRSEYPMSINPEGIPGPPGPPGQKGEAGVDALTGYSVILGSHSVTGVDDSWTQDCEAGKVAIDGGAMFRSAGSATLVLGTLNAMPSFDGAPPEFQPPADGPFTAASMPDGWHYEFSNAGVFITDGAVYANDFTSLPIIDYWVACINAPAA